VTRSTGRSTVVPMEGYRGCRCRRSRTAAGATVSRHDPSSSAVTPRSCQHNVTRTGATRSPVAVAADADSRNARIAGHVTRAATIRGIIRRPRIGHKCALAERSHGAARRGNNELS